MNNQSNTNRSIAAPFSVAGASLIAALLVITNYITSPNVIWFIYPLFAVAWWPMSVILCGRKMYFAFSLAGASLTMAFLVIINLLISPSSLWSFYALPLVLCWPLSLCFKKQLLKLPVTLLLSAVLIAYCIAINLLITPQYIWAIYPVYLILWWPLIVRFALKGEYKKLSVTGAILTIVFFVAVNLLTTPYPFALYACFPVIWWPIAMYAGNKMGSLRLSVIGSICTAAWYSALNILLSAGVPWALFVAYAVLWWPVSVFFKERNSPHGYAAVMSTLSIVFLAVINALFSPETLWAHYPAFALLWWPMTLFFVRSRKWFGYALTASGLTIVFLIAVNLTTSAGFLWSLIPALCILWWPLAVFFAGKNKSFAFAVAGSLLLITLLVTINLLTSARFLWSLIPALCILWWPAALLFFGKKKPFWFAVTGSLLLITLLAMINLMTSARFVWSLFPALCILWWPVSVYFAKKKRPLGFAAAGTLLTTALFLSINLLTSPGFLWFVFPVFGVLWWPVSVFFNRTRKRKLACQG